MLKLPLHIIILLTLGVVGTYVNTNAQPPGPYDTIKVNACIEPNGDTIPCGWLEPIWVDGHMNEKWRKYHAEWTRLRNAIYVTYPYAKAAGKTMNEINAQLIGVNDKKKRKAIIQAKEKELKSQFTDKLKNLSVYQGKVLMKLICRETGNNCYEIVDEYKGHFSAVFWQSVAFVFGSSLKQSYNSSGADAAMEVIVQDVERMYGYRR
ncbi:MAG: DUF4294 domain-containing protein [Chitinophagaceae bacterium]